MPAPEGRHRYQPALLWPCIGVDNLGQFVVDLTAEPEEIRVRFNDHQSQALDRQGNTITLDATAIVNQEIAIGSRMAFERTLDVWNESGSAEDDTKLMEVKTFNRTPDIRNRANSYTVGLLRYHNP